MSDYDSGLPVRSEADGADERVQTKIVDANNPDTQQMEVDTDNNAHVEVHGNNPVGGDETLRLSELGHPNTDGLYDGTDNTDPSNSAVIAHSRNASPADTQSTERVTSIEDSGGTVRALDISLHDEDGEAYGPTNPLPVSFEESEGDELDDFNTSAAVAKDISVNHDYTVTAAKTLLMEEILASGSGKMKVELQLETAAASGVFDTKVVMFNSTAKPNVRIPCSKIRKQVAGAIVRIKITNRDNQAQDLYSNLLGVER